MDTLQMNKVPPSILRESDLKKSEALDEKSVEQETQCNSILG